MAIQALPESAIRSLGSGQALTDPVSLIKELIENSLDAQATKISIDVSQNIIDSVQVSDNGYGISPEDRESACVRHCTSKIRCYEDIDNCGTLGFRGEALASAAALSEKLVFITKVEGEQVATECEVGHDGRVKSTKSTRAPVGTTIKVTGFLKTLPVRKQSAIKYASTNLKKIKKLIATYYLSRPQCRFSLKVLNPKGRAPKNKEQDIVYAPSKSVQAAVGVLVGIKTSSTFQWVSTVNEASKIHIEAFLPTPNSDIAQISTNPTCTQYIYVDSRPVSCTRGTLKTVLSLYRSYLKSSFCTTTLSDPFIYLNIICPPNTYDPNVEPAKDDVLFQDTDAVQAAAEDTFIKVYGKLPVDAGSGGTGQKEKPGGNPSSGFKVLLARREEPREKLDKSPETIPAPDDKSNSSVENAIDPAQINSRSLEVLENEPPKELLGPGTVLQGDGDSDIAVLDTPPVDVESPILDRSAVCEINEDNLPSPPPLPLPEEEFELIDEGKFLSNIGISMLMKTYRDRA
ncbi:histidine kinase-like ATPase [Geopyxis carbonaria]|nr:histidine kinase-like ATPase [Geopyxis carbonaria]